MMSMAWLHIIAGDTHGVLTQIKNLLSIGYTVTDITGSYHLFDMSQPVEQGDPNISCSEVAKQHMTHHSPPCLQGREPTSGPDIRARSEGC